MRAYTVHTKNASPETAILIKEGFSWVAFFFTAFWAAWHRMWLEAGMLCVLFAGTGWLLSDLDFRSSFVLHSAFSAIVGMVANEVRRAHLARKGWQEVAALSAKDSEEAEAHYFASLNGDGKAGAL